MTTTASKNDRIDELLRDDEVARIIIDNPDKAANIRAGAQYLLDREEELETFGRPIAGLRVAARAIAEERINLFISYKKREEEVAKHIEQHLSTFGGERIRVNYAAHFTPGFQWTAQIRAQVRDAHWFILLLPDPSLDWDWVLFETGMFRAQMVPGNRLVCLHHRDTDPPRQIAVFQAVKAECPEILRLLNDLFIKPNAVPGMDPINPKAAAPFLERSAETIRKEVSPPHAIERQRFEPFVRIKLDLPTNRDQTQTLSLEDITQLLKKATFDWKSDRDTGTNAKALEIFGKLRQPRTWDELLSTVKRRGTDERWCEELCLAISQAVTGYVFAPIQATFQAADNGRTIYRPVLYGAEKYPDGLIAAFLIVFITDVGGTAADTTCVPFKGYAELISSIRLSYRFRWEVVEPFKDIRDMNNVTALEEALQRVMGESASRGEHNLEELAGFFGKNVDRVGQLYRVFMDAIGELRNAIKRRDTQHIQGILTGFAPANQEYLKLSTAAFAQMNEEIFSDMTTSA